VLTTPLVVSFVNSYFNSDLIGAPLEDNDFENAAQSHWEKSFFNNDLMT